MPVLPSATEALAIDTDGGVTATSSLVIVPVAVAGANLAPDGLDRVTVNVSGRLDGGVTDHRDVHLLRGHPGAKVNVPEVAV